MCRRGFKRAPAPESFDLRLREKALGLLGCLPPLSPPPGFCRCGTRAFLWLPDADGLFNQEHKLSRLLLS
jgi:hypothetical protein